MSTTTLGIIEDYVQRVYVAVKLIRSYYGVDDLLRARRERAIPSEGTLDDDSLTFKFHGIGCAIQARGALVDFDFGPSGIVGGFDSWRLFQFVESCGDYDESEFTQERLQSDIQELEVSGVVLAPKQEPSPHLFYLANDRQESK